MSLDVVAARLRLRLPDVWAVTVTRDRSVGPVLVVSATGATGSFWREFRVREETDPVSGRTRCAVAQRSDMDDGRPSWWAGSHGRTVERISGIVS